MASIRITLVRQDFSLRECSLALSTPAKRNHSPTSTLNLSAEASPSTSSIKSVAITGRLVATYPSRIGGYYSLVDWWLLFPRGVVATFPSWILLVAALSWSV